MKVKTYFLIAREITIIAVFGFFALNLFGSDLLTFTGYDAVNTLLNIPHIFQIDAKSAIVALIVFLLMLSCGIILLLDTAQLTLKIINEKKQNSNIDKASGITAIFSEILSVFLLGQIVAFLISVSIVNLNPGFAGFFLIFAAILFIFITALIFSTRRKSLLFLLLLTYVVLQIGLPVLFYGILKIG